MEGNDSQQQQQNLIEFIALTRHHLATFKEALEKIDSRFERLEEEIRLQREDDITSSGKITEMGKKVNQFERNQEWLIKLVTGAIVIAVLTSIGLSR
jgi:glutamine synthetase adenylyltransferase